MTVQQRYGTWAGETHARIYRDDIDDTGRPWAMFCHGFSARARGFVTGNVHFGPMLRHLSRTTYVAVAGDNAGPENWGGPAAVAQLDADYTAGVAAGWSGTVSLFGYSMGAFPVMNWARRNPGKVHRVVLFAPSLDLAYAHSLPAFAASVEAIYPNFAVDSIGYDPQADAAEFAGMPISIWHGSADATVPLAVSQNFVAAVNDPACTLTVLPGAGHSTPVLWVSPSTIFQALAA